MIVAKKQGVQTVITEEMLKVKEEKKKKKLLDKINTEAKTFNSSHSAQKIKDEAASDVQR